MSLFKYGRGEGIKKLKSFSLFIMEKSFTSPKFKLVTHPARRLNEKNKTL